MFKFSKSKKLDLLKIYSKNAKLYDFFPWLKRKRRFKLFFKILKFLSFAIIALFVAVIILFIVYFSDVKKLYSEASTGKRNIEKSLQLLTSKNYSQATDFATQAEENFVIAGEIAKKYSNNKLFKSFAYLKDQTNDVGFLISSIEIISRTLKEAGFFAAKLEAVLAKKDANFNQLSSADKQKLLEIIYKSAPELNGIKASLNLAVLKLKKIKYNGILFPFKPKVKEFEEKLAELNVAFDKMTLAAEFMPSILGYPQKATYLFILQNSDELRPTGGFIGTYGILQTENGDILRFDTHDIYHLDMPVSKIFHVVPPEALQKEMNLENWYMRDANWSPDWQVSAKKIDWFYHSENTLLPPQNQINNFDGEFDGIIGITPKFITDLLSLLGPVYIKGEEFNATNFIDLLQYKVEKEYIQLGLRSWHRKEIIGEIVKELKIKMFNLSPREMYQVLNTSIRNLDEKNILLSLRNKSLNILAQEKNWLGEIKKAKYDYLMVVDANMASLKTDAAINRKIKYKLKQNSGLIEGNLFLSYSHNGKIDWKTGPYHSYTRVYVPKGSQLISAQGMKDNQVSVFDEGDKTVFAFVLKLDPGKILNLNLNYQLPNAVQSLLDKGYYKLYVQKQPGNDIDELSIMVDLSHPVGTYYPTGLYAKLEEENIFWESDLFSDRQFIVKTKE